MKLKTRFNWKKNKKKTIKRIKTKFNIKIKWYQMIRDKIKKIYKNINCNQNNEELRTKLYTKNK